jgi:hypothetical protein
MAASKLEFGRGSHLWDYWTKGPGVERWLNNPHPWTTLRLNLLSEGVPAHMVDGLTTNIFHAVTGTYPAHKDRANGHPTAGEMVAANIASKGK